MSKVITFRCFLVSRSWYCNYKATGHRWPAQLMSPTTRPIAAGSATRRLAETKVERSWIMAKRIQIVALIVAAVFGAAAVVSDQQSGEKITIKRDTKLGSEVLPKGEYTLRVAGSDK